MDIERIGGRLAATYSHDYLVLTVANNLIVANRQGEVWAHPLESQVGAPVHRFGALNNVSGVAVVQRRIVAWIAGHGFVRFDCDDHGNLSAATSLGMTGLTDFASLAYFTAVDEGLIAVTQAGAVFHARLDGAGITPFARLAGATVGVGVDPRFLVGLPGGNLHVVTTRGEVLVHRLVVTPESALPEVQAAQSLGYLDIDVRFCFAFGDRLATLTGGGKLSAYRLGTPPTARLYPKLDAYYHFKVGPFYVAVRDGDHGDYVPVILVDGAPEQGHLHWRLTHAVGDPKNNWPLPDPQAPHDPIQGGLYVVVRHSGKAIYCRPGTVRGRNQTWESAWVRGEWPIRYRLERVGLTRFRLRTSDGYLAVEGVRAGARLIWRDGPPDHLCELELAPALDYQGPETKGVRVSFQQDPVERYMRILLRDVAGEAASALFTGGGGLYKAAFDVLFPDQIYERIGKLLNSFREDILREVRALVDQAVNVNNARLVRSAFAAAEVAYFGDYMAVEKVRLQGLAEQDPDWARRYERSYHALWRAILAFRQALYIIEPDESSAELTEQLRSNVGILRQGFPLYLLAAVGYMNSLEELALLCAYHPSDAYKELIERALRPRADVLLQKVEKMFDLLVEDRLGKYRRNPPNPTHVEAWDLVDDEIPALLYRRGTVDPDGIVMGLGLHASGYTEWFRSSYRAHIRATFRHYTYPYVDAAQRLRFLADEATALCERVRGRQGRARAVFGAVAEYPPKPGTPSAENRDALNQINLMAEYLSELGLRPGAVVELAARGSNHFLAVAPPFTGPRPLVAEATTADPQCRRFVLEDEGGGRFALRNMRSRDLLTAWGATAGHDAERSADLAQLFRLSPAGGDHFSVCSLRSGEVLSLKHTGAGHVATFAPKADRDDQRWRVHVVAAVDPIPALHGSTVFLRNVGSDLYLDVFQGLSSDGTQLIAWSLHRGPNQQFQLSYDAARDLFTLAARHCGRVITVWKEAEHEKAVQWQLGGGDAQRFALVPTPDGRHLLRNAGSRRYLCVPDSNRTLGTAVVQRTPPDTPTVDPSFLWELIVV